MLNNEFFMQKCIELAKQGIGKVSPNPLVGCIIVDDKGNIISTGYHQKYGEAHAEQNALKLAGEKAKGATLFVNLEPCNHYGKTPACSELIVKAGIKKVLIGCCDINKKAQGGIKTLKNAGIEVVTGILERECLELNEIFFTHIKNKRPFIAIKTATTLDGKIATKTGSSKWITSENAREEVQKLRNYYDAILTSSKTVTIDNPSLTCRMGNSKNPIRIVVDKNLILQPDMKIFNNDKTQVIVAYDENLSPKKSDFIKYLPCKVLNNHIDLKDLFSKLYELKIGSVLVEAGGIFNGAVLKTGLVDKIYQFIAPKIAGDKNAKNWVEGFRLNDISECKQFQIQNIKSFTPDIMLELIPKDRIL